MPDKSGGLNASTQHRSEVQSACVSIAKFVRERQFKETNALFRSEFTRAVEIALLKSLQKRSIRGGVASTG